MLHGVGAEKLYALLTGPLAVLIVLLEREKLVDNPEKALVLPVDDLDSYILLILPLKVSVHRKTSLMRGRAHIVVL